MDTYTGRPTSEGEWVAFGPHLELVAHHEAQDLIEVTTRTRNVARARVSRVGRSFKRGGSVMAYGYLAAADTEEGAA